MKRKLMLAALALMMTSGAALAQEAPPRIDGADLLVDLAKLAGHPVIIKNVSVWGADNGGALARASGVTLKITTDGIDPETFRHILKNCATSEGCPIRQLAATPTGDKRAGWPILKDVKIVE